MINYEDLLKEVCGYAGNVLKQDVTFKVIDAPEEIIIRLMASSCSIPIVSGGGETIEAACKDTLIKLCIYSVGHTVNFINGL